MKTGFSSSHDRSINPILLLFLAIAILQFGCSISDDSLIAFILINGYFFIVNAHSDLSQLNTMYNVSIVSCFVLETISVYWISKIDSIL